MASPGKRIDSTLTGGEREQALQNHPELDHETTMNIDDKAEVLTFDLGEGRTARLEFAPKETLKLPIDFTVEENTCGRPVGHKCIYITKIYSLNLRVVWQQHPNASKIGKVVKYKYKGSTSEYQELKDPFSIFGASSEKLYPKLGRGYKDYIYCKNWSWIDNKDSIDISAWHAQEMEESFETKVTENQFTQGLYQTTLNKFEGNKSIRIVDTPKFYYSNLGMITAPHMLESISAMFYTSEDKTCMSALSVDTSKAFSLAFKYTEKVPTESDYLPYRKGMHFFNKESNFYAYIYSGNTEMEYE